VSHLKDDELIRTDAVFEAQSPFLSSRDGAEALYVYSERQELGATPGGPDLILGRLAQAEDEVGPYEAGESIERSPPQRRL